MTQETYKFGPPGDVYIKLIAKAKRDYASYEILSFEDRFKIQLICHAALQLRNANSEDSDCAKENKHYLNNKWRLICYENDEYYTWEEHSKGKLQLKKEAASFTYPIYDLVYEGKLIFSMIEALTGIFEVIVLNLRELDECIDRILPVAQNHAECYGRMSTNA